MKPSRSLYWKMEISPSLKKEIIAGFAAGLSAAEIATELQATLATVLKVKNLARYEGLLPPRTTHPEHLGKVLANVKVLLRKKYKRRHIADLLGLNINQVNGIAYRLEVKKRADAALQLKESRHKRYLRDKEKDRGQG